ncbi:hypothetical protein DPMN_055396 [Dreissena polymorpha]|uniref:Uncharacterized protein n=1 Tax=Dreissena polymorpha TaxID=45954 RepID=A0A9D4CSJ4_DREPO|nr:hypothetical protein DPMN_055396 [Dreissena polymorpha]
MFENKPNPNIESKIALCIIFLSNEAPCVPPVLLYEMTKTGFEHNYRVKMSLLIELNGEAGLDARVFMYYLQYLTYGGLGIREKQIFTTTYWLKKHENEIHRGKASKYSFGIRTSTTLRIVTRNSQSKTAFVFR